MCVDFGHTSRIEIGRYCYKRLGAVLIKQTFRDGEIGSFIVDYEITRTSQSGIPLSSFVLTILDTGYHFQLGAMESSSSYC